MYHRPAGIDEAVTDLATPGARALAGGTDLIAQLREGRRTASVIVDLKHIAELTDLARAADGAWRIGAACNIRSLGADAEFAREHAGLLASARLIGSLQIQSRASIGGNVLNAAPSADAVPLLIALGAKAEIAGPDGRREVAVENLFAGPGRNTLGAGELLVSFELPPLPTRSAARYLRFTPRREMDIAVAGSGVAISLSPTGEVATACIVLASVGPVPIRAGDAADRLIGQKPNRALLAEAGRMAASAAKPISDTRGSAEYRRELVATLTQRALADCCGELGVALS